MSPEQVKFFQEVESLVVPTVPVEIEYRIHYNEFGDITMCSMVDHPESARYVVVTKDQYENYFRYIVIDGKLKKIDTDAGYRVQLRKTNTGFATVTGHAGIVVETGQHYPNVTYYDFRNN